MSVKQNMYLFSSRYMLNDQTHVAEKCIFLAVWLQWTSSIDGKPSSVEIKNAECPKRFRRVVSPPDNLAVQG